MQSILCWQKPISLAADSTKKATSPQPSVAGVGDVPQSCPAPQALDSHSPVAASPGFARDPCQVGTQSKDWRVSPWMRHIRKRANISPEITLNQWCGGGSRLMSSLPQPSVVPLWGKFLAASHSTPRGTEFHLPTVVIRHLIFFLPLCLTFPIPSLLHPGNYPANVICPQVLVSGSAFGTTQIKLSFSAVTIWDTVK